MLKRIRTVARGWIAAAAIAAGSAAFADARWDQFRGPGGSGIAENEKPPVEFGPSKNLLWSIAVPKGHSCPVIWDDRIFLTGFAQGKLETICINPADGKVLWRKAAPTEKIERYNGVNSPATPTPATDGKRVYVLFGSYGAIAYDFDGNEKWRKPIPLTNVRHGSAASPIVAGGKVIINGDQEDMKSFVMAIDAATGQTAWQTARPNCFSSHTTPVYLKRDAAEEVVLAGSIRLAAYDLKDGSERWSCRGLEAISICPSPAAAEGVVYAMSFSMPEKLPTWEDMAGRYDANKDGKIVERESPRLVKDVFSILDANHDGFITREEWDTALGIFKQADNGLFAVRAGDKGDVSDTHVLWRQKQGIGEIGSPLCYRGRIYTVRGGGMVSCLDAKTGRPVYEAQRTGVTGAYYASPVAADGKIYIASTQGTVVVIEAGDVLKVLARNELGESITATPAIADNKIYVRTAGQLFAFGEK